MIDEVGEFAARGGQPLGVRLGDDPRPATDQDGAALPAGVGMLDRLAGGIEVLGSVCDRLAASRLGTCQFAYQNIDVKRIRCRAAAPASGKEHPDQPDRPSLRAASPWRVAA